MKKILRAVKNEWNEYNDGEILVRELTKNDNHPPNPENLQRLNELSKDIYASPSIYQMLNRRLHDLNYLMHVEKALIVVEYLLKHGDTRFVRFMKMQTDYIKRLRGLKYMVAINEFEKVDKGLIVRRRANRIYALLTDDEELEQQRYKTQGKEYVPKSKSTLPRPSIDSSKKDTLPSDDERSNQRQHHHHHQHPKINKDKDEDNTKNLHSSNNHQMKRQKHSKHDINNNNNNNSNNDNDNDNDNDSDNDNDNDNNNTNHNHNHRHNHNNNSNNKNNNNNNNSKRYNNHSTEISNNNNNVPDIFTDLMNLHVESSSQPRSYKSSNTHQDDLIPEDWLKEFANVPNSGVGQDGTATFTFENTDNFALDSHPFDNHENEDGNFNINNNNGDNNNGQKQGSNGWMTQLTKLDNLLSSPRQAKKTKSQGKTLAQMAQESGSHSTNNVFLSSQNTYNPYATYMQTQPFASMNNILVVQPFNQPVPMQQQSNLIVAKIGQQNNDDFDLLSNAQNLNPIPSIKNSTNSYNKRK